MKKLFALLIATLFVSPTISQVRTPTLYVAGTVLSEEKMLVSVRGTKTIEGNVVSAEINGKKTETKTDKNGHALLEFSTITAGLVDPVVAVIKSFDKDGKLIGTANTTVEKGNPKSIIPFIEQLPKNLPNNEAITIFGEYLGADAKMICGQQKQETLSASDREITVFTNANTGEQPVYVSTPNGVSKSQMINIYSLDFALSKNSITPGENVQAAVSYKSIPVGTKLIFTNKSTETINMTIPGAQNAGAESIFTVAEKNGSFPVNITGISRGNFIIALDFGFRNEPAISELKPSFTKLNENDQKLLFGFMSAEAKCALWKDHLSESLKMPLQSNQKDLVQELDSHLNPDIFSTTTASTEFKSYALGWLTRAKAAFSGSDAIKLANIVTHLGSNNTATPLAEDANIPDCDCVRNGAILNCPIYFNCRTRNCRTNWCGIFWLWTCDAQCI